MVSYGARQHIRKNALQHLHQEMSLTRKQGSLTLEDSLARLVNAGSITPPTPLPGRVIPTSSRASCDS